MQSQILFHDTMAYGSHHHMTNFKFQNVARETILFESKADGKRCFDEQAGHIVMLTREAYSLNLAPVQLGQKVGILLSYAEPTHSTFRLCFRVLDEEGTPVCCGYQTMILIDKDSHNMVPAPPFLAEYLSVSSERNLLENLKEPSFADLAKSGSPGLRHIFPENLRNLGKMIATAPRQSSHPRIIDENHREFDF